ncbi:hypothetical protein RSSM_06854 [Rhodopirellula sallentina SM41]|uniref:Uncharacterized protein n=1 Tax=Rhodopirellula sallentina SM41 TaxID=1263870 RepID=M5TRB8_9BACT|nr:hypothetical protein RSSM_06854 [Rhodopirellula sallentina SM41]
MPSVDHQYLWVGSKARRSVIRHETRNTLQHNKQTARDLNGSRSRFTT